MRVQSPSGSTIFTFIVLLILLAAISRLWSDGEIGQRPTRPGVSGDAGPERFRLRFRVDAIGGAAVSGARLRLTGPGGEVSQAHSDAEGECRLEAWRLDGFPYRLRIEAAGFRSVDWRLGTNRLHWYGLTAVRLWPRGERRSVDVRLPGRFQPEPGDRLHWRVEAPPGPGLVSSPRIGSRPVSEGLALGPFDTLGRIRVELRRRGRILLSGSREGPDSGRGLRLRRP